MDFSIAKGLDVCKHMSVEVQLLKALENKIALSIPKVIYYSKDDYIFGYKKIPGALLSREIYMQLTPAEKNHFADDFARFLCELHTSIPLLLHGTLQCPLLPYGLQMPIGHLSQTYYSKSLAPK